MSAADAIDNALSKISLVLRVFLPALPLREFLLWRLFFDVDAAVMVLLPS